MKKSKYILFLIISIFFIIVGSRLIYLNGVKHDDYEKILANKIQVYVYGGSAPRGRILDTNGKIIVDNKGINTIYYHKIKGIKQSEEIKIARTLARILSVRIGDEDEQKEFYLLLNGNGKNLITEEEYQKVEERKLTTEDLKKLKLERITTDMLSSLDEVDKKASYIYSLMNKGYLYQKKEIIRNPDEAEYAKIMEMNIPGITSEMTWERVYNYGNSLKSILGSIGSIPKEKSEEYLSMGYELTDVVGLSYLEKEYEEYLKGTKAKYLVNRDNTLELVEEASKGNDLVLSIDIDIQQKVESVLQEKILLGKTKKNTEYYHDSYALVSDPNTGAMLAMSGQRYSDDKTFSDITSNIINTSYTIGSAVKGATIAVGYKNNLINMGKKITDSCVKLYSVPAKCSHKKLGRIDDTDALAQSSNYFQYLIAIHLVGKDYTPNMVLGATKEHFDIYRNTLSEFGLGVLTGIDLPGEQAGIKGSVFADDLLLNLAIGQYDTYTPIEMIQYINTIASGSRMALSLMKKIGNDDNIILEQQINILNKLDLEDVYLNRIREGMQKVLKEGTGKIYVSPNINGVGKTGTSESFYDADGDNKSEVATITSTFAGYFPASNPKFSVVVITPNISHKNGIDDTMYFGASKITKDITDFLFENY